LYLSEIILAGQTLPTILCRSQGLPERPTFLTFTILVEVRRRMGQDVFEVFHQAIIDKITESKYSQVKKTSKNKDKEPPNSPPSSSSKQAEQESTHKGKLVLDATVAEQAIRFPTDLSLLNEARELTEKIIAIGATAKND